MRETLDQWLFVYAAYGAVIIGTLALLGWSVLSMQRAERRRDKARKK